MCIRDRYMVGIGASSGASELFLGGFLIPRQGDPARLRDSDDTVGGHELEEVGETFRRTRHLEGDRVGADIDGLRVRYPRRIEDLSSAFRIRIDPCLLYTS